MTAPSETAVSPTILDPDGDILLTVGSSPKWAKTFKVSSSAMRRASPVWKAMLFGGWAESKKDGGQEWRVSLPEDDPTATGLVLAIIHSHFELVPKHPAFSQLLLFTVVADKYDVVGCCRPWVDEWIRTVDTVPTVKTNSSWTAHIAWNLGKESLFVASVRQLCLDATVKNGEISFDGHFLLEGMVIGPGDLDGKQELPYLLLTKLVDHEQASIRTS